MFKKYLLLISTLGFQSASCMIEKHEDLPDHLQEKYKIVDPKKEIYVPPNHNLTENDLKPRDRDTTRRKEHFEIVRAKDHHYTVEELEHKDHITLIESHHIDQAKQHHEIDLKKRKKLEKENKKKENKQKEKEKWDDEDEDKAGETFSNDDDLFEEEWEREQKPDNPDHEYLFNMIIVVHFREKFKPENKDNLHDIAGGIESSLYAHEIDYQQLTIHEDTQTVHILCNDHEERDHIRHQLLWNQRVLVFYSEKKRYWTRFGDEREQEQYRDVLDYNKRQAEKAKMIAQEMHDRIEKQMREQAYQEELQKKIEAGGDDIDKPTKIFGNYHVPDFEEYEDL